MTNDSDLSSFSLSFDDNNKNLLHTPEDNDNSIQNKKQWNKGRGHPYRMRLNKSTHHSNEHVKKDVPYKQREQQDSSLNRQPRHPFLRGARDKTSQSQQNHQDKFERTFQRKNDGYEGRTRNDFNHQDFQGNSNSSNHSGEKRGSTYKPRNLFPYQRSRRVRANNTTSGTFQQAKDTDYDRSRMNEYDKESCEVETSREKPDHFLRTLGNKVVENTKVFYKKRRHLFSSDSETQRD